jgi:DNA-binding response OmpR family regulator
MLVVDDDTYVRMMFAFDLPDVELVEARGVTDADAAANAQVPDAVVVDRRLPDGDGLELVRRLRGRAASAHVPIVVLTAGHDPADEPAVLRAGADAYLAKPFEASTLMRAVEGIMAVPAETRRETRRSLAARLEAGAAASGDDPDEATAAPSKSNWLTRLRS